jgi:hypothetical protein
MGMQIIVECYSGYRGEETPRTIWVGNRRIAVEEMLDRWLAPDHRYFKFKGDDQGIYIIRHDGAAHRWELIFFQDRELRSKSVSEEAEENS